MYQPPATGSPFIPQLGTPNDATAALPAGGDGYRWHPSHGAAPAGARPAARPATNGMPGSYFPPPTDLYGVPPVVPHRSPYYAPGAVQPTGSTPYWGGAGTGHLPPTAHPAYTGRGGGHADLYGMPPLHPAGGIPPPPSAYQRPRAGLYGGHQDPYAAYGRDPYAARDPYGGAYPPDPYGAHPPDPYGAYPPDPYGMDPYGMEPAMARRDGPENLDAFKWTDTPEAYGPVLDDRVVEALSPPLDLHPLLRHYTAAAPEDAEHVIYDLRMPLHTAYLSSGPPTRGWRARSAAATFPAVETLHIVSRAFPWLVTVKNPRGVRCGDVLEALYRRMHEHLPEAQYQAAGRDAMRRIASSYHSNRQTSGGTLMDGMLRVDWLCENTRFEGLVRDDAYVKEKLNIPNWKAAWVLVCGHRGT